MVDLPNYSVLISGLEFWSPGGKTISEPRLARKLARVLEIDNVELRTPPPADDSPGAGSTGVSGFQFPEWFITQGLEESKGPSIRTRLLVHRKSLTKGKYIDRDKKKEQSYPFGSFELVAPATSPTSIGMYSRTTVPPTARNKDVNSLSMSAARVAILVRFGFVASAAVR